MTTRPNDDREFDELEARLRILLPEQYQDSYDEVLPVPMRSAGLKYGSEGKVAWDEIWGSFCDLAMAGGPSHKGTLLEPGGSKEIKKQSLRYREVVDEICRGIHMVTGLGVEQSPMPGWVRVYCTSAAMSGWLVRAITMENVAAISKGLVLYLPAGPTYRLEKEIKNVVTVMAKTSHYWSEHMSPEQHRAIATLFRKMDSESPLVQPALPDPNDPSDHRETFPGNAAASISQATGLAVSERSYAGWFGLECLEVRAAVWMMRMFAGCNVLSRREGTVVFVPVNAASDPDGEVVAGVVRKAYRLAVARNIFQTPPAN